MKVLLLTVAGLSSRFSESVGYSCLKCIYHEHSVQESLLYRMLDRHELFDRIVIVGGFKFRELEEFVNREFAGIRHKLLLVENTHFADYGSGYSFQAGVRALERDAEGAVCDELIFAEGDLFVDDDSFRAVCMSAGSVMTYTRKPIYADKSVAFYLDMNDTPHYIYDTAHGSLRIDEPFKAVFNSGQVWKFARPNVLRDILDGMSEKDLQGTNLVPVNAYFQSIEDGEAELVGFRRWVNCNTLRDFHEMMDEEAYRR